MSFHYLERSVINERLRLNRRQSFRLIPSSEYSYDGLLRTCDIVRLLNEHADGETELDELPTDLVTADEIEAEFGPSAHRIVRATKRTKSPLPCFRFNRWTLRFRKSTFTRWMERGHRNMGAAE